MYSEPGLPYDGEDATYELPVPSSSNSSQKHYNPLLDQSLDDLIQDTRSSSNTRYDPRVTSDRFAPFASRISEQDEQGVRSPPKSKIYLLSEVKPVVNHQMASDLMEEAPHIPEGEFGPHRRAVCHAPL